MEAKEMILKDALKSAIRKEKECRALRILCVSLAALLVISTGRRCRHG